MHQGSGNIETKISNPPLNPFLSEVDTPKSRLELIPGEAEASFSSDSSIRKPEKPPKICTR
jgi:hypothetical protein